jgi:cold shock CspA family protein
MSERRLRGELVAWKGDRSFGFIRPDGADADMFVSGYELRRGGAHDPQIGDCFTFETATNEQGKTRAMDLHPIGAEAAARQVFAPVRQ